VSSHLRKKFSFILAPNGRRLWAWRRPVELLDGIDLIPEQAIQGPFRPGRSSRLWCLRQHWRPEEKAISFRSHPTLVS
jgi:hypothetical protein